MNFQHKAIAVKGGKIIATGENGYKGRKFSRSTCTTHAEVNCIQNMQCIKERKRKDVIIWSILEGGHVKKSQPCFNCCKSLFQFGIRKIGYFDGKEWIEKDIEDVMKTAIISSGDRRFQIRSKKNQNKS